MRYFMCTEGDAGGTYHLWNYYEFPNTFDKDDALEWYLDEHPWHRDAPEGLRLYSKEITAEQYKAGLLFNVYYREQYSDHSASMMFRENIFPLKIWAEMFANERKPVRIGYPNFHQVYRLNVDKDGNRVLSYQYDYDASKFGVLKAFQKAYPV